MNQLLIINKNIINKTEIIVIFLLFFYYLNPNIPLPAVQAWALFGFITVPLLIIGCWKRFIWVALLDIPLLLLVLLVPISVLWTTTPEETLNYCRAFVCSTAFGIYLAARHTPKELIKVLLYLFVITIFINLAAALFFPSYGIYDGGWVGINRYKNYLAATMVIITTLFLDIGIFGNKNRHIALVVAGLGFFLLVMSRGKGSLGMFIGSLVLYPLYKVAKQEYRLRTILSIVTIILVTVVIMTALNNLEFIVVDLLGKDMGFNGRDRLWTYLIERGLERPWLGYGYAGFWNNPAEGLGVALKFPWINGAGQGGGNSHSSYMEIFLQLGFSGLSLMIISLLTYLYRVVVLLGLTRQLEFFWMLQLLVILMSLSYSDTIGFLSYRNLYWVLYISSAYSSAISLKRIIKTKNRFVNVQFENS